MQHRKLMTNSFPIALNKQIADDMKIFGSLSDDTKRAIDCVNADTFCKPVNLTDIKSQVAAITQTLIPSITYDRATAIAFATGTIITRVFSATWTIAVWTAKSLHLIALVAIGLVLMAVELWQDRRRVKAAISDQYLMLCLMGSMFIRLNVIMPAKEFKVRSRVAFKTMTVGLDY